MTQIRTWSGNGLASGALTTATAGIGDTAFDEVVGTINVVASGNKPAQLDIPAVGSYARWTYGSLTAAAYRGYWTAPPTTPGGIVYITRLKISQAGAVGFGLSYNTAGTIRIYGVGGAQVGVSNITMVANTQYRLEWIINHGNGSTTGTATLRIYDMSGNLLDSVTVTGANFGASHNTVIWGTDVTTNASGMRWDELAVGDTDTFLGDSAPLVMSLQLRLAALANAIGTDIKALQAATVNPNPWSEQILTSLYTNATVTGTDVFTGFAVAPNTRYLVDVLLTAQSVAATSGIQTAILGPTTGIVRSSVKVISAATATTDMISHQALNAYQAALNSLTTPHLISIQAIVEVGASPGAGNIRVGARTEVAAANAVQIFAGSSMRWRII